MLSLTRPTGTPRLSHIKDYRNENKTPAPFFSWLRTRPSDLQSCINCFRADAVADSRPARSRSANKSAAELANESNQRQRSEAGTGPANGLQQFLRRHASGV